MADPETVGIFAILLLVAEGLGLILAVDSVMRPRSSQGAIAWFICLITIPLLAVPFYLVFGRSRFEGYTEALREAEANVAEQVADWYRRMADVAAEPRPGLAPVEAVVARLTRLPFTRGNRVRLLIDGAATYDAMLDAVATAESYILVQFYIVRDDETGRRLRDALIEKARAGVRVYFLYDEVGSIQLPARFLGVMRDEDIAVSGFKTTRGPRNRFQINFRNHRKILIVDGRAGFVGGHNLGDEYLGFRDTHLRLDGPSAQQLQVDFLTDWYWAKREVPPVSTEIRPANSDNRAVAIVSNGPADSLAKCGVLFATLISTAQRRIWIASPYFVPDDATQRVLQAAALRGVDVRIIVPDIADHRIVELASFTYYGAMLEAGVRLYRFRDRFMHQKVILVDDGLSGIGTVNLDNRSFFLNFEVTALVADDDFAKEVAAMLERDFEQSDPVDRTRYDGRSFWFRAAARTARLASPLL